MNVKTLVIALVVAGAVSLMAWPSTAVSGPQQQLDGWFSGGVKHEDSAGPSGRSPAVISFALSCDPSEKHKHLQITWGRGNRFRLDELTENECFVLSDSAGVWMPGRGTGSYNGVPGARVQFVLIDVGEPGTGDFATAAVFDADDNLLLNLGGDHRGNVQFHQE